MNNPRLLTGMLMAFLSGAAVCCLAQTQKVMTLESLFELAEANSVQLRPSFGAETEAAQEIRVAQSKRLPDINTALSVSYIGDGFITKRNFSSTQKAEIPHLGTGFSLNVNQPLYTGGAITSGIELARLKSESAGYATDAARDNLRFQLAGYYFDIYKFHNLRDVLQNNLSTAHRMLDEMKSRYSQGVALQNDITRYELLVSNLELQLVSINNSIDIYSHNLATLVGLPDTRILPDTTILQRSQASQTLSSWSEQAESNSPLLNLARNEIQISRKGEDLVKSDRLPKVGLQAAFSMDGPILVEIPPINRNLGYWYVGLGVSYELSSLYKNNKSLARSRVATNNAMLRYDAALENVSLELNADYVRYMEAYQQLATHEKSLELADRNYNTISTRYTAGMALITDLLDAADARLQAGQNLVNARINIIYYYYKLLYTSGRI